MQGLGLRGWSFERIRAPSALALGDVARRLRARLLAFENGHRAVVSRHDRGGGAVALAYFFMMRGERRLVVLSCLRLFFTIFWLLQVIEEEFVQNFQGFSNNYPVLGKCVI